MIWTSGSGAGGGGPSASDVIEGRLVEVALRALELGIDVVIAGRAARASLAGCGLGVTRPGFHFARTRCE
jgi:hypothetical protein